MTRTGLARRLAAAAVGLIALGTHAREAQAHHVPGHGSSEGVKSINTIGNRGGQAQTRLVLLGEFTHAGGGRTPGQQYATSMLAEYAPIPEFSVGAQFPLQIIDERGRTARVGYGDTRLQLRYTPHATKLIHRVLTVGVNVSLPTRTVRTTADPGKTWAVAPNAIFTRTYARWFWQVLGVGTVETRPAGTSLDLGAAGQAGVRLVDGKLNPGAGVLVESRLATWCVPPGEGPAAFCRRGRATETRRELGSTRATALLSLSYNFTPRAALWLSAQAPFAAVRDYDVGATIGLQGTF